MKNIPPPSPVRFDRADFLDRFWVYRPGEHVTLLGPTGCGKTTLGYQLLERSATPKLPAITLVMKPRDSTARDWNKRLGHRIVRTWPPMPSVWQPRKPAGWTLWPKHTFDPDRDDWEMYRQFRAAILDSYKRGNRILFGDEVYGLAAELKLERELRAVWTRGRSMSTGLWAASQKPTHIPLWAYSMAQHLFLYHDPDKRARDRFSEIGGVDPEIVSYTVANLQQHEVLYIRRRGGAMAILSA